MGYLRSHDVIFEPIERWPGTETPTWQQKRSPFAATWKATLDLLDRELSMLGAKRIVVQAFVKPGQLRLDGGMRSGTNPTRPGIILSFDTPSGPMQFPCDTFDRWGDNLRGIALALEALRKVDRYGVTRRAEQYAGFKALPAPGFCPGDEIKTPNDAKDFLRRIIGGRVDFLEPAAAIREASKATHPDAGGDADNFKRVMRCEQLLKA